MHRVCTDEAAATPWFAGSTRIYGYFRTQKCSEDISPIPDARATPKSAYGNWFRWSSCIKAKAFSVMRSISESERFQKLTEVFEVKKTCASCSKKAKWRLQKQLRLTKIIGPTPIIFLSCQNQPVCLHNPLTMALFLLGWGKWDRKVVWLEFWDAQYKTPLEVVYTEQNVEEIKLFLNFSSLRVIHHAKNTRFQWRLPYRVSLGLNEQIFQISSRKKMFLEFRRPLLPLAIWNMGHVPLWKSSMDTRNSHVWKEMHFPNHHFGCLLVC